MHRRRTAAVLAALATALTLISACSTGADAVDQTAAGQYRFQGSTDQGVLIPAPSRKSAPTFSGTTLAGRTLGDGDFKGKVVLINFWGQWCPPCRVEAPYLQSAYQRYGRSGFAVLGVDVKDVAQLARAFMLNKKLTYPSLFDPDSRVALAFRDYPAVTIPSTILVDRNGRVAGVYTKPLVGPDVTGVVRQLLAEK